jgi:hypothetical protein
MEQRSVKQAWLMIAVLTLASAPPLRGQGAAAADSGVLRGQVLGAETGQPLPFAMVSIPSIEVQRFADGNGRFVIPRLAAGTYRLRVRHLGHSPVEHEVTLDRGAIRDVTIRLPRIAIQIAAMNVSATWECETPGRPASDASSQVAAVFEQLEQNAERLRLLAQEYPFEVDMERRFLLRRFDGTEVFERADTTIVAGLKRTSYRPGRVVNRVRVGPGRTESFMTVPTLVDFADPIFQRNHCFRLRGVDDSDGTPLIRVDFKAWRKLTTPDVDGSVFLDTAGFRLRRSELSLTRIPSGFDGLLGVRVTTEFSDVRPGLPIAAGIRAINEVKLTGGWQRFDGAIETQKALLVRFLNQHPDSVPPVDDQRNTR